MKVKMHVEFDEGGTAMMKRMLHKPIWDTLCSASLLVESLDKHGEDLKPCYMKLHHLKQEAYLATKMLKEYVDHTIKYHSQLGSGARRESDSECSVVAGATRAPMAKRARRLSRELPSDATTLGGSGDEGEPAKEEQASSSNATGVM